MKKFVVFLFFFFNLIFFYSSLKAQFNLNLNACLGINKGYILSEKGTSSFNQKGAIICTSSIGSDIRYFFSDSVTIAGIGLHFLYQPFRQTFNRYNENFSFTKSSETNNFFYFTTPVYLGRKKPSGFKWYLGLNFKFLIPGISDKEIYSLIQETPSHMLILKKITYGLLLGLEYELNKKWNIALKTDLEMPGFFENRREKNNYGNWNTMLGIGYKINLR